jgi:RimJ/RimL family protein N-acetyltransferase
LALRVQRFRNWKFAAILAVITFAANLLFTSLRRIARRGQSLDKPVHAMNAAGDVPKTTEIPSPCEGIPAAALVRESERVRLRRHVPANRDAFQRWYADPEIANLLRHDLRPLNEKQSRSYFDTIVLPLSASGHCFAIHDVATDQLIGTTALTETDDHDPHAMLFRIVIGEKSFWDKGMGTEATRLVVEEAFEVLGLDEVRLEVFAHNPRAITVYERVGFVRTGERTEWVGPNSPRLHVFEMSLHRPQKDRIDPFASNGAVEQDAEAGPVDEPALSDTI